jgi:hypothetical protein
MACSKFISFAEVVQGRETNVRLTDDGLFDVVDTVMVVTGKNCNHSNETLRNMKSSLFDNEKFVIRDGRRYATPRDIIALIMVLPGKMAKELRSQFADIIEKHIAVQHDPISGTTTLQLQAQPVTHAVGAGISCSVDSIIKKRQLEREDTLFEMEMEERRQKLLQLTAETSMKAAEAQMKVMDVQKRLRDEYTLLCPNQVMEDRVRLQFKDNLLNIASSSTPARMQAAIGDGSGTGSGSAVSVGNASTANTSNTVNPNKPITISTLAAAMGYRFDSQTLQKIGKKVAAAYWEKYGEKPGKHEQLVGQASVMVCSYTERDRGMVERAIVDFINE